MISVEKQDMATNSTQYRDGTAYSKTENRAWESLWIDGYTPINLVLAVGTWK